jgi:hypothetical protein
MILSKYTRGSRIHKTLEMICMMPSNKEQLKNKISTESMNRFVESCIDPLLRDKFIVKNGDLYHSTPEGEERFLLLGATKKQLPSKTNKNWVERIMYTGEELKAKPVRPGADDHEQCPSLMGDKLFWRDGRKEVSNV